MSNFTGTVYMLYPADGEMTQRVSNKLTNTNMKPIYIIGMSPTITSQLQAPWVHMHVDNANDITLDRQPTDSRGRESASGLPGSYQGSQKDEAQYSVSIQTPGMSLLPSPSEKPEFLERNTNRNSYKCINQSMEC